MEPDITTPPLLCTATCPVCGELLCLCVGVLYPPCLLGQGQRDAPPVSELRRVVHAGRRELRAAGHPRETRLGGDTNRQLYQRKHTNGRPASNK